MEDSSKTEVSKERLIRDASYSHVRGDKEPILDGAFKGALASGLLSRVVKTKSRIAEGGLLAGGATIGAFLGNKYNNSKIEKKNIARNKLKELEELDSKKGRLRKHATAQHAVASKKDDEMSSLDAAKNSALFGAGTSLAMEGLRTKNLKYAGRKALSAGVSGGLSGYISHEMGLDSDTPTGMVVGGAIGGAIEGAMDPAVGYMAGKIAPLKREQKGLTPKQRLSRQNFFKHIKDDYRDGGMWADLNSKYILRGAKGKSGKLFTSQGLKDMRRSSLRGGLMGGAFGLLGYGMSKAFAPQTSGDVSANQIVPGR